MRTPKKIREAIVKRVKSWRGSPTAKGAAMEEPRTSDMPKDVKDSLDVKEQTNADKATETDTELYEDINTSRENLQPIFESSEEAQIETTVEQNVPESPSFAACFDSTVDEKSSKKAIQPIVAGVVGAALLVSSIVAYILKMYAIAVVGGIVVV